MNILKTNRPTQPSLLVSLIPLAVLLIALIVIIYIHGAYAVQDYSYYILGAAAIVSLTLGTIFTNRRRCYRAGMAKSARQILPAVPILIFIGTLSATWMLSGVVPTLIDYGLEMLDTRTFLFTSCIICSIVSVMTGSSWSTIATIGVALMSIGTVMGYHPGWVAGAIISGAYFGDKVSPLSDTTVLAASTCGVPLTRHIRFLMFTSIPAMTLALIIYLCVGYFTNPMDAGHSQEMLTALNSTFNITSWTLIIPALTLTLIVLRINTTWTLAIGSIAGFIGMWAFQPQIITELTNASASTFSQIISSAKVMLVETELSTGNELLDPLVSTGGAQGMLPTVWLVLSAMVFGGAMIATGMLGRITHAITSRLNHHRSIVGTTVGCGLFLNSATGDQYLSIIIGGNIFKNAYRRQRLKPQLLSRTLEDSISVTSVLIPWNSCAVTQSTVLGVATLIYLPFCLFNIFSPLMSLLMSLIGWRLYKK